MPTRGRDHCTCPSPHSSPIRPARIGVVNGLSGRASGALSARTHNLYTFVHHREAALHFYRLRRPTAL